MILIYLISEMILLYVDDWINIEQYYSKYEVVTFRSCVVESPEESQINMDDALFGMTFGENFKMLKDGISHYFGSNSEHVCLFWDNAMLDDEDTPETVGMAGTDSKHEELEIHIKANFIEM
jgi:hypothetical protein